MGPILPHAPPSEMAQKPAVPQNRPFYLKKKKRKRKRKKKKRKERKRKKVREKGTQKHCLRAHTLVCSGT